MEVKLAVLADYANVSREGKLNILGIFGVINTPKFPVKLPSFCVVISFEAGTAEFDSDKEIEIVLCDEDGTVLFRASQTLHVSRPQKAGTRFTTNLVGNIVGFPFQKPGQYQFDILVNKESKTTIPFQVNELKPD